MKGDRFEQFRQIAEASSVGIILVVCTIIGLIAGYYLDKWFNTLPWFTICCLFFGIIAGFINIYDMIKKIMKNENRTSDNGQ